MRLNSDANVIVCAVAELISQMNVRGIDVSEAPLRLTENIATLSHYTASHHSWKSAIEDVRVLGHQLVDAANKSPYASDHGLALAVHSISWERPV